MIPGFLKNAVINTALKRVAASGDGGSTILGTLVTLLLAEKIDWDLAFQVFSNPDMPAALEAGKVLGIVLLWLTLLRLRQEEVRGAAAKEDGVTIPATARRRATTSVFANSKMADDPACLRLFLGAHLIEMWSDVPI